MKCPKCGGEQRIIHWTSGQPRYLTCERCGGSGRVESMTNKEWLQSMDEKELAKWLHTIVFETYFMFKIADKAYMNMMETEDYMEMWLKEKHE